MNARSNQRLPNIVQKYLLIWVEIAETQTPYSISSYFSFTMLAISYLQLLSNIVQFSTDDFVFQEIQILMKSVALIDICYDSKSSQLIQLIYVALHIFAYLLVALTLYLAILSYYDKNQIMGRSAHLTTLYELANTTLSTYQYCLFQPLVKINFSILISGLVHIRYDSTQIYLIGHEYVLVLAIQGLALSIFLQLMVTYFFRNYEYNDKNPFKRKFSAYSYVGIILSMLIQLTFILNLPMILEIVSILHSIYLLYDSLKVRPFYDQFMSRAYIYLSSAFFMVAIVSFARERNLINEYSFFVMSLIMGSLAGQVSLALYDIYYMNLLLFQAEKVNMIKNYQHFCNYVEEVLRLFEISHSSDVPKMLLHIVFRYHVVECKDLDCFTFQLVGRTNDHFNYNSKLLIMLMNQLFKTAINNESVIQDVEEFEIISLKYVSYTQKYLENYLLSYFFLKKLAVSQKYMSFYYSLLFEVYSDKIHYQMQLINFNLQNANKLEQRENDGMSFYTESIQQVEQFSQNFSELLVQVIQYKLQIWQSILMNSNSMDDLLHRLFNKVLKLIDIRKKIIKQFQSVFGFNHNVSQKSNAGYHKLQQVYEVFVMNDVLEVRKLDQKISDLRKRDQYKEEIFLNNHNFMNADSIIVQAGLSVENGKILNRNNQKIPQFFGYTSQDWAKITTINHLMPGHISILHNQILTSYLQKGYSPLMTTARKIFLINKSHFIFPVSISVRNDYLSLEDCVFNVTLLKISSNKEVIMLDEYGKIIGFSQKLYEMLSSKSRGIDRECPIDYDFIRQKGYLQLLSPQFVTVFDQIRQELHYNEKLDQVMALPLYNLQLTMLLSSDIAELTESYLSQQYGNTKEHLSLLKQQDSIKIESYLQKNRGYYQSHNIFSRLKLKFTLHAYYRGFEGLDEKILRSITSTNQQIKLMDSMRYYVIECSDVFKMKSKITTNSLNFKTGYEPEGLGFDKFIKQIEEVEEEAVDGINDVSSLQMSHEGNPEVTNIFDLNYQDYEESLSEMKENLVVKEYGDRNKFKKNQTIVDFSQGILGEEITTPRSQVNSIISPQGSSKLIFQQAEDLDNRKKNFLMKMVEFQKKRFFFPDQIYKPTFDDQREEWPQSLTDIGNQTKVSKLIKTFDKSTKVQEQNEDVSNGVVDSDNQFEEEDKLSINKDEKVRKENQHWKVDMEDLQSQNSKGIGAQEYSITYLFLNQKKPKQYYKFLIAIFGIVATASAYTLIQLIIANFEFQALDTHMRSVNTAYRLQNGFIKGTSGVILQNLSMIGVLQNSSKLSIDERGLFQKYQTEALAELLKVIGSQFGLLRQVQSLVIQLGEDLKVIQFYDQTLEHLNRIKNSTQAIQGYNIVEGLVHNYVVIQQLHSLLKQNLQIQEDELTDRFYIVFYVILVSTLIQIIFVAKSYKTFLQFQEKILLVLTRVNLRDYEKEVAKLEFGRQQLRDTVGSFIVTSNLVAEYTRFEYRSNIKLKQNNQDSSTEEAKLSKKFTNQSQLLSSRIYNPSLSMKNQTFQFIVMAIILIIYYIGAILFAIQTPPAIRYLSDYYLKYSEQFSTIQQVLVFTEIKGARMFLIEDTSKLGQFQSYEDFENYYTNLLDTLNQFTSQDKVFQIQESENNQIIQLLYGDLCLRNVTIPNRLELNRFCQTDLKSFYSTGIIGMIKNLLILFYSYQNQIDSRQSITYQQTLVFHPFIKKFLQLKENWALCILFPDTFGRVIDRVLDLIQNQLLQVTSQQNQNTFLYLSISGILIDLILLAYLYIHLKDLNKRLTVVEYLLTLIPHEKLQESVVMHMIKQIEKF